MKKLLDNLSTGRLLCGKPCYHLHNPGTDLVGLFFVFDTPAITNTQRGVFGAVSNLLNEGPRNNHGIKWHKTLEDETISIYAWVSYENTVIYTSFLKEDLDRATALIIQLLSDPAWDKKDWKLQNKQHRLSLKQQMLSPSAWIGPFGGAPLTNLDQRWGYRAIHEKDCAISYPQTVETGQYILSNLSLRYTSAYGDLTLEEALNSWNTVLDSFDFLLHPHRDRPFASLTDRPPQRWAMDSKDPQVHIYQSKPGILPEGRERIAQNITTTLLGSGMSSRLFKRIRDDLGNTYGIYCHTTSNPYLSPFTISTFTHPSNLQQTVDAIQAVLDEVIQDGFSEKEVIETGQKMQNSLALSLEHPFRQMRHLEEYLLRYELSEQEMEDDWRNYTTVTTDDVNTVARKLLEGDFHLSMIGPTKEIASQLGSEVDLKTVKFKAHPDTWPLLR